MRVHFVHPLAPRDGGATISTSHVLMVARLRAAARFVTNCRPPAIHSATGVRPCSAEPSQTAMLVGVLVVVPDANRRRRDGGSC